MNAVILEKIRPFLQAALNTQTVTQAEYDSFFESGETTNSNNYQLFSPGKVAEMLSVTRATVNNRVNDGSLERVVIGGIPRITAESVERLIQSGKDKPVPQYGKHRK